MTPAEQAELERLREVERAEIAEQARKRDAMVKSDTGREWLPEPSPEELERAETIRKARQVPRVTGLGERGETLVDCAKTPEERWEEAGYERDPATGQYRRVTWSDA